MSKAIRLYLTDETYNAFIMKCKFFDLHPSNVMETFISIFANTTSLNSIVNINEEDDILYTYMQKRNTDAFRE